MIKNKRLKWASGLLLVGLLLAAPSVSAQTIEKPYKEQLSQVEGKLNAGDIVGALAILDQVISAYPEAAEVHYAKSLLYGQARNFAVAIPAAELAQGLEPKNLVYANYLLELYKGNSDLASALRLLDKLVESFPANPQILREKIFLLHASKQSDLALKSYDEAVSRFGKSDTLDIMKAEILLDQGNEKEAQALIEPWEESNSSLRQVYSMLAFLNLKNKDAKEAIRVLEKGIVYAKDDLLYMDLADAYAANNKDKQAFESLKTAFNSAKVDFSDKYRVMFTLLGSENKMTLAQMQELANTLVLKHPRIADSHVAKGNVLWKRGNLQEARSIFLTAIGINPNHVDAWRMLINIELSLNEVDEAIQHSREALQANPKNPMLSYFSGIAYMVNHDLDNARKMMESALDNSTEENPYMQSLIYSGLGDLYHELKMASASDVAYEEAIKLDSVNATAMNNLAYYLALRGENLATAAKHAQRANELDPNSGTFQDTYAWVLFKQEKYPEALLWIEKAVKNSTASSVLLEHYGDILAKSGRTKEALKQWERALADASVTADQVVKIKEKIAKKAYVE